MKPTIVSFSAPYRIIILLIPILLQISVTVCHPYTLTVTPKPVNGTVTSSVGGINCGVGGSSCVSTNIPLNTPVTLLATPDSAGYTFTSWTVGGTTSTTNPLSFTMPGLNISGSVTFTYHDPIDGACGSDHNGTFTVEPSSDLCLTGIATTVTGSPYNWSWNCNGRYGGTNVSCGAQRRYQLNFAAGNGGSLTGQTSQQLAYSANAGTVTAVPENGRSFIAWTEGETLVSTAPALTVTNVTASHSYTAHFTGGWTIEPVDTAKYFNNSYSRAIATEKTTNRPHIVYGGDRLYHAYFNGSQWLSEVVDAVPFTGEFASIVVDNGNKVHISYYDVSNRDLKYATNATGSWTIATIDSGGDVGQYNSMAADSSGNLHISYYDATNKCLKYVTNASGSWSATTVISGDRGKFSSLAIDGDNKVHISFYDSHNRELVYATNTPGYWWWYVVDSSWTGEYTSIAVDANKTVHISYYDQLNYRVKYATGSQTGWTRTIIEDTYIGELSYTSLALDSAGKVHISYYDNWKLDLKYATNASGTWVSSTIDSTGLVGQFSSLTIDGNNRIHISYYDETNRSIKYGTNASGAWAFSNIDSAGDVGMYSSLVRDASGKAHISYYDARSQDLKYATNSSGSWVKAAIDTLGNVGQHSSLAVDSNSKLHISYYDGTNQDLKYATNSSGAWATSAIDTAGSVGWDSTLAIDSANRVHICYLAGTTLKYATNTSGSWNIAVIDSSTNLKQNPSIAVDANNKVHIGYVTDYSIKYATNITGTWAIQTVDNDPNWLRYQASMALDQSGKIHFSYFRKSAFGPYYQYQLAYSANTSGSWSYPYPVDDVSYNGADSSIATDSTGKVRISYNASGVLRYASNANGAWQKYDVDGSGDTGTYSSLKLDSFQNPYISYYNAARRSLIYASKPDLTPPSGTMGWLGSYSSSQSVTLSLSCSDGDGSGCTQMRFSNDGTTWSSPVAFAATSPWTLSPGDGLKTVYARFRDAAGNWSFIINITTSLDTTAPSGSITINNGAAQTGTASVTLTLSASDAVSGLSSMQFSNDNVNWTAAQAYAASKSWTLPAGAGMKTVYVRFRDMAGNWSGTFSDSIELAAGAFPSTVESLDTGSAIVGRASSIAVDADDKVHIGYHDATNRTLKYASNVTGIWAYTVIDAVGGTSPFPSLKIDSNNKSHVSYYYEVYTSVWVRELRYATNVSGSWVVTTIETGNYAGERNSLAVDHNNKAHVSYRTYDSFTGKYVLKYATNASGAWVSTVIDNEGSVGFENAITVDSLNHVHIAYYDLTNTALKYATNASGAWVKTTVDDTADVGRSLSVAIDAADKLHISHLDVTNNKLKYASNSSGGWQSTAVDPAATTPYNAAIGVDANGRSYIGYTVYDTTLTYSSHYYYAKLITNISGSWVSSIVDTGVSTAGPMSLAIDTAQKVHMCYSDYTADDLRYAYVDPTVKPGVAINAGATYANALDADLDLTVSGGDMSRMHLSADGLVWTTPETYSDTRAWTLAAGDGMKKVYAQFRDNAGNWSSVFSGAIILDMTPPVGTIIINKGDKVTESRSVVLSLAANDVNGIAGMAISNFDFFGKFDEPYSVTRAWTLPANDGVKTVYARFRDNAGNWSAASSDSIILDYQETLTAHSTGNGSGTVASGDGGINYSYPSATTATVSLNRGAPVTVTAMAASGSTVSWQDCASNGGTAGGSDTTATCTFGALTTSRTVTATFTKSQYTLAVDVAGSGSGSVLSNPQGIAGNVSSSAQFEAGTAVVLQAIPASYSIFAGWSGGCNGAGDCNLVMDSDRQVSAIFDFDTAHKVRIGDTENYASTLQTAYETAPAESIIKAWGTEFDESLSCGQEKNITLKGGYDDAYGSNNGHTTLIGVLSVKKGSVCVERLTIR